MENLQIELMLLEEWEKQKVDEVYKYKDRIKFYRGRLASLDLFYDLSKILFQDMEDLGGKDHDCTPSDVKISVKELINRRTLESSIIGD